MATMTPAQVAAFAYAAGITNMSDLVTAVAIPARESGYNPGKFNQTASTQDDSWGLWQIDVLTNPTILQQLGLTDKTQLTDPWNNARAMALLYKSGGNTFNAWGPYKGLPATYNISQDQLNAAAQGVAEAQAKGWLTPQFAQQIQSGNRMELGPGETPGAVPINTPVTSDTPSPLPKLSSVTDLISELSNTVFSGKFWKFVGMGALGVLLIVFAFKGTETGQTVINTGKVAAAAAV